MLKNIRKNKFFRKTLVFASVFIILIVSCSTVIFAQAPNYDNIDLFPHDGRLTKVVYFSDGTELLFTFNVDYITENVTIRNCNFVFTDYYFQNYFTGDVDQDFLNISTVVGNFYIVAMTQNQSFNQVYVQNTTFYSAMSTRGLTSSLFSQYFKSSYNDQLAYWNYYKTYYDSAYSLGYTQSLNDFKAFENGLYTIFNAPFVFVQNIIGFEIFGISLIEVLAFILLICLGYICIKFIGGAIPL